jgi:hypothetical protein
MFPSSTFPHFSVSSLKKCSQNPKYVSENTNKLFIHAFKYLYRITRRVLVALINTIFSFNLENQIIFHSIFWQFSLKIYMCNTNRRVAVLRIFSSPLFLLSSPRHGYGEIWMRYGSEGVVYYFGSVQVVSGL